MVRLGFFSLISFMFVILMFEILLTTYTQANDLLYAIKNIEYRLDECIAERDCTELANENPLLTAVLLDYNFMIEIAPGIDRNRLAHLHDKTVQAMAYVD